MKSVIRNTLMLSVFGAVIALGGCATSSPPPPPPPPPPPQAMDQTTTTTTQDTYTAPAAVETHRGPRG